MRQEQNPTGGAKATMPAARNSAILMLENLEIPPPLCILMMLWPNKAHPPIPPVNPLRIFPHPCPMHSRLVDPRRPSSIIPSINYIVRRDSIQPTAAMVKAYGKTVLIIPNEKGTEARQRKPGKKLKAIASGTLARATAKPEAHD
jgi:hypothetical protein